MDDLFSLLNKEEDEYIPIEYIIRSLEHPNEDILQFVDSHKPLKEMLSPVHTKDLLHFHTRQQGRISASELKSWWKNVKFKNIGSLKPPPGRAVLLYGVGERRNDRAIKEKLLIPRNQRTKEIIDHLAFTENRDKILKTADTLNQRLKTSTMSRSTTGRCYGLGTVKSEEILRSHIDEEAEEAKRKRMQFADEVYNEWLAKKNETKSVKVQIKQVNESRLEEAEESYLKWKAEKDQKVREKRKKEDDGRAKMLEGIMKKSPQNDTKEKIKSERNQQLGKIPLLISMAPKEKKRLAPYFVSMRKNNANLKNTISGKEEFRAMGKFTQWAIKHSTELKEELERENKIHDSMVSSERFNKLLTTTGFKCTKSSSEIIFNCMLHKHPDDSLLIPMDFMFKCISDFRKPFRRLKLTAEQENFVRMLIEKVPLKRLVSSSTDHSRNLNMQQLLDSFKTLLQSHKVDFNDIEALDVSVNAYFSLCRKKMNTMKSFIEWLKTFQQPSLVSTIDSSLEEFYSSGNIEEQMQLIREGSFPPCIKGTVWSELMHIHACSTTATASQQAFVNFWKSVYEDFQTHRLVITPITKAPSKPKNRLVRLPKEPTKQQEAQFVKNAYGAGLLDPSLKPATPKSRYIEQQNLKEGIMAALNAIGSVATEHVVELLNVQTPSKSMGLTIGAVCLMIGTTPTWKSARRVFKNWPVFLSEIYDVSSSTLELNKQQLQLIQQAVNSSCGGMKLLVFLERWVSAMFLKISYNTSKKEVLNGSELRIEDLKENGDNEGESFESILRHKISRELVKSCMEEAARRLHHSE